jgi:hypothetical protein
MVWNASLNTPQELCHGSPGIDAAQRECLFALNRRRNGLAFGPHVLVRHAIQVGVRLEDTVPALDDRARVGPVGIDEIGLEPDRTIRVALMLLDC